MKYFHAVKKPEVLRGMVWNPDEPDEMRRFIAGTKGNPGQYSLDFGLNRDPATGILKPIQAGDIVLVGDEGVVEHLSADDFKARYFRTGEGNNDFMDAVCGVVE